MTLTASASPATERDVMSLLGLINPIFVRRSLNRTNIFYVVRPKSAVTVSVCKFVVSLCKLYFIEFYRKFYLD